MILIIMLFFTVVAIFFKLKYVLSLYIISNILLFFLLGLVLHPLQTSYIVIYSQLPAFILSALGIYIGQKFQSRIRDTINVF